MPELKLPKKLTIEADSEILHIDIAKTTSILLSTGESQIIVESTGTGFLPAADEVDDTDPTYFYFGWELVGSSWLVRRQLRTDSSPSDATMSNNPTHTILAAAWAVKETLNYE